MSKRVGSFVEIIVVPIWSKTRGCGNPQFFLAFSEHTRNSITGRFAMLIRISRDEKKSPADGGNRANSDPSVSIRKPQERVNQTIIAHGRSKFRQKKNLSVRNENLEGGGQCSNPAIDEPTAGTAIRSENLN